MSDLPIPEDTLDVSPGYSGYTVGALVGLGVGLAGGLITGTKMWVWLVSGGLVFGYLGHQWSKSKKESKSKFSSIKGIRNG